VTYAVFMRRPVIGRPPAGGYLAEGSRRRGGAAVEIEVNYDEGKWVGAGEAMLYVPAR